MPTKGHPRNSLFGMSWNPAGATLVIMLTLLFLIFLFLFLTLTAQPAQGQTFSVLHNFTGGGDGARPDGLILDRAGNLYGTTFQGGLINNLCPAGCGTVFKMSNRAGGWILAPLYQFQGTPSDGTVPQNPIFGPNGRIYGTTAGGSVFELAPPVTACLTSSCSWSHTQLYDLGDVVPFGDVAFDRTGDVYGATFSGGEYNAGSVYELTPAGSGWMETVIYSFQWYVADQPEGGVIFDAAGILYGTTPFAEGYGCAGIVYNLTPSEGGWTLSVFHCFNGSEDGGMPVGDLIFDPAGNLYGTTYTGGPEGGGTVYMLTPSGEATVLYGFDGSDGVPLYGVSMDAAGNVYGTTYCDGTCQDAPYGTVFMLRRSNGSWTYSLLHTFTGGSDGGQPEGAVAIDANGNVYGTAAQGGGYGAGVVFEITP